MIRAKYVPVDCLIVSLRLDDFWRLNIFSDITIKSLCVNLMSLNLIFRKPILTRYSGVPHNVHVLSVIT